MKKRLLDPSVFQPKVPTSGTIYLNGGRYWWRGVLPGETVRKAIPLIPMGAKYATKDIEVAKAVLQDIQRRALIRVKKPDPAAGGTMIGDLIRDYIGWCQVYYKKPDGEVSSQAGLAGNALRFMDTYAREEVDEFGPLKLKLVRDRMIVAAGECNHGAATRKTLSRVTINHYCSTIKAMFKWGVENERVPAMVYFALLAVPGLKKGRSEARETPKVKPARLEAVEAVLPYCSTVVADMIRVQVLTGMRSTELCLIRPAEIDMSGEVWLYHAKSKSEHLGYARVVAIGPRAQAVLLPYLERYCPFFNPKSAIQNPKWKRVTEYLFDPREAWVDRLGRGVPADVGSRYDKDSYRKAVDHGFTAAKKAGLVIERFNPHRLRHTAGTAARREGGLDAAKAMLGHQHVETTEIYSELEIEKAVAVARKIG